MISNRIWCSRCGHEGPREIAGTLPVESMEEVFASEGHDPYSGKLYFRCPRCKAFITVDPTDALGFNTLKGYPNPFEIEASRLTKKHNLLPVWSGMYSLLVLLIIVIETFS